MPGFDGTGPAGLGPMTGRGLGYCVLKTVKERGIEKLIGFAGLNGRRSAIPLDAVRQYWKEGTNMPGGDGTGPAGMGPMTGRAAGYCAGYPVPGFMNPAPGVGGWPRGEYFAGVPAYGFAGWGGYPRPLAGYPYRAAYGPVWGRPFGRWFGRGVGRGRGRW